ncbi:MAG TPA: hypothetical protein VHX38_08815 [Pseudonocardiaceae bacterium]|jgi:hypothetical protein|nr:hypothetical protein [Pseudonocardiaceae bacterium]
MGKHELDKREYGSRYYQTRTIQDLTVLAERILADLPPSGTYGIPASAELSIHVLADVLLQIQVGGLSDDFTFLDRISRRYSRQAKELITLLTRIMNSHNWTNPDDLTDRRFFTSVYLLPESEYRCGYWVPGVISVF